MNVYDAGIYLDAIQRVQWNDLNPMLYSFGVRAMSDHWHPLLYLFKPFVQAAQLLGLAPVLMMVLLEYLIVMGSAYVLYLALKMREHSRSIQFFLPALWVFNVYCLGGLYYPIHPSLWIMLTFSALIYFELKQSPRAILITLFLMTTLGEQFVFGPLLYSFYEWVRTKKSTWIYAFVFFALNAFFAFVLRKHLFEHTLEQGAERVSFNLIRVINSYRWDTVQFLSLVKYALFVFAVIFPFRRTKFKTIFWNSSVLKFLLVLSPLLAGRLLSASFGFHYDCEWSILIVGLMALSKEPFRNIQKKDLMISGVLAFLLSFSYYERSYRVASDKKMQCYVHSDISSKDRNQEISKMIEVIRPLQLTQNIHVLSSQNLYIPLMENFGPKNKYYGLNRDLKTFENLDYLAIEHGPCGDSWPYTRAEIELWLKDILNHLGPDHRPVYWSSCLVVLEASSIPRDLILKMN